MPAYLLHGFRWPREGFTGIRVHTIVHNLEECSAEYVQNQNSRDDLLGSFRKAYPELMKELETSERKLEFVEQYDPEDTVSSVAVSQPHAYVADKVVELAGNSLAQHQTAQQRLTSNKEPLLSLNVEDTIANGPGLSPKAWEAMADLRDKLAPGEKIGWWIVYNGDPERAYDAEDDEDEEEEGEEEEEEEEEGAMTPTAEAATSSRALSTEKAPIKRSLSRELGPPVPPKQATGSHIPVAEKKIPARGKQEMVNPREILPTPKDEQIPEPPKLKEVAKKSGFRNKFFGKKV